MRFIVMHKVDAEDGSRGAARARRSSSRWASSSARSLKEGVFLDGAGLHRSAQRVRVSAPAARPPSSEGPSTGKNELVASLAMIKAQSMDDAIETARRFAGVLGDVEIEIGPVVEAWDLGMMPKPANLETRTLPAPASRATLPRGRHRARARKRSRRHGQAHRRAHQGRRRSSRSRRLTPSSKGARLPAGAKGKRTWVDGPFAESKELIAGFSILELPT